MHTCMITHTHMHGTCARVNCEHTLTEALTHSSTLQHTHTHEFARLRARPHLRACCSDDSLGNSDLRVCVMLRQPRGNQDAKVSTPEEKPSELPKSVSGPCDAEEVFGGVKTPESPLLKRNLDDSKRPCLYLMNYWEAQNSEHGTLRKPWRIKTKNVCSSQEVS